MSRDDVRRVLLDAIREVLEQSGQPVPVMTDETRPLRDLDGFDSLSCVEVEVALTERLRCEIEGVFRLDDGRKARSLRVGQLVDDLCKALKVKGVEKDARP